MTRYSDAELEALLDDTESDLAERKESFSGDVPTKARQAICAFANDLPNRNRAGVLFIGAKDDGSPSHLQVTDQMLRSLADMRSDGNILPMPAMGVEKRLLKGVEIAVITVLPSDMPPVKYNGRIWIRTGPRRSTANEQESVSSHRSQRSKNLPFDLYPVPSSSLNDLSKTVFLNEYLPGGVCAGRLGGQPQELRRTSRFLQDDCFSGEPYAHGYRFARHREEYGISLREHTFSSYGLMGPSLRIQLWMKRSSLDRYLTCSAERRKNFARTTAAPWMWCPPRPIGGGFPYPQAAIQQILYNAVLHRTYEGTNAPIRVYWFNDRIEIHSPGGPYGNVTCENFGTPASRIIGIPISEMSSRRSATSKRSVEESPSPAESLKEMGNQPPDFLITPSAVVVTMKAKP